MSVYTPGGGWCLSPDGNAQGLTALLLTFGSRPFDLWLGGVLYTLLAGKGVTGTQINAAINNATMANEAAGNLVPSEAAELFTALWAPNAVLIGQAASGLVAAAQAGLRITNTRLPLLQAQAAYEAAAAQANAINVATEMVGTESYNRIVGDINTLQAAEANTTAQVNALQAWATQGLQAEGGYSQGLATQLLTYIEQQTSATTAALSGLETYTREQITLSRTQAADDAAEAANQATANSNAALKSTLQPVWAGTAESVNQATTDLVAEHPTEQTQLAGISTDIPDSPQLALLGLTLAVKTLAKTATDCALPECTAKNRLGKTANKVASIIGDGLLLALMVEIIGHPEEAAADTADVVLPFASGVQSAVKALVPG